MPAAPRQKLKKKFGRKTVDERMCDNVASARKGEDIRNRKGDNTQVSTDKNRTIVRLHGNVIARIVKNSMVLSDGNYPPTKVTLSRLNTLIDAFCVNPEKCYIRMSRGKWVVNDNDEKTTVQKLKHAFKIKK